MENMGAMGQLNTYANSLRMRLPAVPENVTNVYVAWVPWIALVAGLLGFVATLGTLAMGAALTPWMMYAGAYGVRAGATVIVSSVFALIGSAVDVAGGWLMLKRSLTGWWLLAAGMAVGLLSGLLSFSLFGILFSLAVLYLHVEAKERFH